VELDDLDRAAAEPFHGFVVRKDLVRQFRGQFPVPTYVVEFMLGVTAPPRMSRKSPRDWTSFARSCPRGPSAPMKMNW
jgi:hypothetical protein